MYCRYGNYSTGDFLTYQNNSSSGDEIPERDVTWRIIFSVHLFTTTSTTRLYCQNIFLSKPNDNCYISNGRRLTKSALCILLLSNFRVSSINYSLDSSFPIHARGSANAEGPRAHCQLKSCKMLHKRISILHRFRDINTYLPKKMKTSRNLAYSYLGESLSWQD